MPYMVSNRHQLTFGLEHALASQQQRRQRSIG